MKLTVEQINSFKELGYVFIENVFDAEEVVINFTLMPMMTKYKG